MDMFRKNEEIHFLGRFFGKKYHYLPSRELTYHIPQKLHFEDDFPFPKMGYVSSVEGTFFWFNHTNLPTLHCFFMGIFQGYCNFPPLSQLIPKECFFSAKRWAKNNNKSLQQ